MGGHLEFVKDGENDNVFFFFFFSEVKVKVSRGFKHGSQHRRHLQGCFHSLELGMVAATFEGTRLFADFPKLVVANS